MNEIMRWLAHYNTLVIQVVFTIILVLLAVYVYRLFYIPQSFSDNNSNLDMNEVTERLKSLMKSNLANEVGKNLSTSNLSSTSQSSESLTDANMDSSENPVILKAEINRLKEQLNEAERKIFDLTPTSNSKNVGSETEAAFGISSESATSEISKNSNGNDSQAQQKIQDLQSKLDQLQARLDEYDIISEDIAELSALRAENAQLKKKIDAFASNGSPSVDSEEVVAAPPNLAAVAAAAPLVDEIIDSKIVTNEEPLIDVNLTEELAAISETSVDELDKNLISEFEKSTEKESE